jgi:predicted ArsR family transcriptional regulator
MSSAKITNVPRDVQAGAETATRDAILQVLRDAGGQLRVEDVASVVGLKVSGTRWQLDRLVEAGAVRRSFVKTASRGRPAALYSAAPAAEVDEVEPYRMLAELLAAQLEAVTADPGEGRNPAQQAGAAWADTGAQSADDVRAAIMKLLDDTGFRPREGADPAEIELDQCPFFDVASAHPQVVCGIHADLLRGGMQALGAGAGAVQLIPVLTADQPCRVQLRDSGDG